MVRGIILGLALVLGVAELTLDRATLGNAFDGIGGLSGGGATSVLLPDYAEPARSQILDYLFKPSFGASLQVLKVEIGGDSQSTDGTESSHMHDSSHVNMHTGYEWWLMKEAKKRNPDIKLYGLAWAFPSWVGNGSGSPFKFPDLTARYLVEWVAGAKSEYGLDVDYLGIWNERSSDSNFVQVLRKALNQRGHEGTKLVVKDGDLGICADLQKDKAYADAVDIVGLHYPSDFQDFSVCQSLGKPLWASEESSSYDDLNGAACWGRVVNSHWVINKITSSIMWNLVGAYYHGTNWYGSSMMTAVEPWSGHYEVNPVIWATAHVTHFTAIGWRYLLNGTGSGELPRGGYFATFVDPKSEHFTMNIVKISRDHAMCTRPPLPSFQVEEENLTVHLAPNMRAPEELQVWYSNFESYTGRAPMFQKSTVQVRENRFQLFVPVGSMFTVTTVKTGQKGAVDSIPLSRPSFPLRYADDFQSTPASQNARWFADQIGAFEMHSSSDGKQSLKQMVPTLPIGWSDSGSRGPMTLIGMREWQDVKVQVRFKLPSGGSEAGCAALRVDQMWDHGLVLCVTGAGHWNLSYAGPALPGAHKPTSLVAQGRSLAPGTNWTTLTMQAVKDEVGASLNGQELFKSQKVRDVDTGFVAIGANDWFPIEFRDFSVEKAGSWEPPSPCSASRGPLTVRPCSRNGLIAEDQAWELLPSYQLRHISSGLCASATAAGPVVLDTCDATRKEQLFVNDYTLIRNSLQAMTAQAVSQPLAGNLTGEAFVGRWADWKQWSYFPNTKQLRNQYVADLTLGYPMCLSACGSELLYA